MIIVGLFLILCLGVIYFFKQVIRKAFSFPRAMNQKKPADYDLDCLDQFIPVTKTSGLEAWLLYDEKKVDLKRPLVIGVHGWRETSSALLPIARELIKNGWRCLLINARNHGESGHVQYSTMVTFREDIQAAIDYARTRIFPPVEDVICLGHSVGAASSLYAAVKNCNHINGIVSIASFVDLEGNIRKRFINKMPSGITHIVMRFLEYEIGERLANLSPENAIGKLTIPVLLLHGERDRYATPEMMKMLYERRAGEQVEARLVPGDHLSMLNNAEISRCINDFLTHRFTRASA